MPKYTRYKSRIQQNLHADYIGANNASCKQYSKLYTCTRRPLLISIEGLDANEEWSSMITRSGRRASIRFEPCLDSIRSVPRLEPQFQLPPILRRSTHSTTATHLIANSAAADLLPMSQQQLHCFNSTIWTRIRALLVAF